MTNDARTQTMNAQSGANAAAETGAAHVVYEERGRTAVVRLDRQSKRNALTARMLDRLAELFDDIKRRDDLRAIVLTHTGATFCAGTDIGELAALDKADARQASRRGQRVCDLVEGCPVPVIAAIDGVAVGGGCELALACHLRVASRASTFSLPEIDLGLLPAYGGTQRLPRVVGRGRALAVMLAGERVTADEALASGLVNQVVGEGEAERAALELAIRICGFAPLAVRASLRAVTEGAHLESKRGLELEAELFAGLFATRDAREGTRAFLEKRLPVFEGR